MVIIGCSNSQLLARNIAKFLKKEYSNLIVRKFPDGELYLKYQTNLKNKTTVLVQSFYKNVNDALIEVLFAAITAKDLKAKKIILVAPYFPYFRQDNRFSSGEVISIEAVSNIISRYFDKIILITPHLHRKKNLKKLFKTKIKEIRPESLIADYIKKYYKNIYLIGPDIESKRFVKPIAKKLKVKYVILNKKRFSSRKVKILIPKHLNLQNKTVVLIDDMVSTGHTIIETIKSLKKYKVKKFVCIAVHGLFKDDSLKQLKKYCEIVSTTTIPSKVSKIDLAALIAKNLT